MADPGQDLVQLLRSRTLRSRTGVLLLPQGDIGEEQDVAARLNIEALDYAAYVEQSLPDDTRFVDASAEREIARLDAVASGSGDYDCVMVYNLDLILSKLDAPSRHRIWTSLRTNFPYRARALILALPENAQLVQPDGEERAGWEAAGRLVSRHQPS